MANFTTQLNLWAREPVRVIHWTIAALVFIGSVAGDLSNALNGTETWVGAAIAIGTVLEGEFSRTQVTPTAKTDSSTSTTTQSGT